jgi:hypothetical protein
MLFSINIQSLYSTKQGSNFIAAIAVEREQNAVDHCGNDGNFCRIVQFLYYSDVDQIMRKSLLVSVFFEKKPPLKKYVDMFLACPK